MDHEALSERARRWLSGSRRCAPVFSRIASCAEIPDAIGWSSCYQWRGSTVIECKTSRSDFYADRQKRFGWKSENGHIHTSHFVTKKRAQEAGWPKIELPMMGDYRFYFSEPGIITAELVELLAPDHGLIYALDARRIQVVRPAPRRKEFVDKDSEIRYLRFAILNGKQPYSRSELAVTQETMPLVGND